MSKKLHNFADTVHDNIMDILFECDNGISYKDLIANVVKKCSNFPRKHVVDYIDDMIQNQVVVREAGRIFHK